MRKLLGGLVAIALLSTTFISCQKDNVEKEVESVSVEFVLNNPYEQNSKKAGGDEYIPICNDELVPDYVHIEGTVGGLNFSNDLDLLTHFEDGKQTALVKLPVGDYTISKFEVLDVNGTVIYASPLEGSYYDELYEFENNVSFTLDIKAFKKIKIPVDVLCWRETNYLEFGYAWFEYNAFEAKTICFFGDVCTKFYDEWHENGIYANQEYYGYDFPAIFSVIVGDAYSSNKDALGEAPVCIEYLDNVAIPNESYVADIYLMTPDNDSVLVGSVNFTDNDWTDAGVNPFGGEDGIYEFNVGDCGTDVDASYPLPWMPLPSEMTFTLRDNGNASYFGIDVNSTNGNSFMEIKSGGTHNAWCGNKDLTINYGTEYRANVYPWYDALNIPDFDINTSKIETLNYIVNHIGALKSTYGMVSVQNLIWEVLGQSTAPSGIALPVMSGYIPPLGGWGVVFIDPYEKVINGNVYKTNTTERYQMVMVRVDP